MSAEVLRAELPTTGPLPSIVHDPEEASPMLSAMAKFSSVDQAGETWLKVFDSPGKTDTSKVYLIDFMV